MSSTKKTKRSRGEPKEYKREAAAKTAAQPDEATTDNLHADNDDEEYAAFLSSTDHVGPPDAKFEIFQKVYARDDDGLLYAAVVLRSVYGAVAFRQCKLGYISIQETEELAKKEQQEAENLLKSWYYYIHFDGWNVKWDRWVIEDNIYRQDNPVTQQYAKRLVEEHKTLRQSMSGCNKSSKKARANIDSTKFAQAWRRVVDRLDAEYLMPNPLLDMFRGVLRTTIPDSLKHLEQLKKNQTIKNHSSDVTDGRSAKKEKSPAFPSLPCSRVVSLAQEQVLRRTGLTKRISGASQQKAIILPDSLKKILVDQWEIICQCGMVATIPAPVTVRRALDEYLRSKGVVFIIAQASEKMVRKLGDDSKQPADETTGLKSPAGDLCPTCKPNDLDAMHNNTKLEGNSYSSPSSERGAPTPATNMVAVEQNETREASRLKPSTPSNRTQRESTGFDSSITLITASDADAIRTSSSCFDQHNSNRHENPEIDRSPLFEPISEKRDKSDEVDPLGVVLRTVEGPSPFSATNPAQGPLQLVAINGFLYNVGKKTADERIRDGTPITASDFEDDVHANNGEACIRDGCIDSDNEKKLKNFETPVKRECPEHKTTISDGHKSGKRPKFEDMEAYLQDEDREAARSESKYKQMPDGKREEMTIDNSVAQAARHNPQLRRDSDSNRAAPEKAIATTVSPPASRKEKVAAIAELSSPSGIAADGGTGKQQEEWKEMADGIAMFFDEAIENLLYREEQVQFRAIRKDFANIPFSELYGTEHLLRLVVRLPELLSESDLPPNEARTILAKVNDLVRFLHKNQSSLFGLRHERPSGETAGRST